MTPEFLPLNSFNTTGSTATSNCEIVGGRTLDEILIEYNYDATVGDEFDPSHIKAVRLNLNTEDIIDVPASDLIMLESYKQGSVVNGTIMIPLIDIVARTYAGQNNSGLVTFKSDAISLEVETVGAKATSGTVVMKAYARWSPSRKVREVIPKLRRFTYSPNGAGVFEITNIARGPEYLRMHLMSGNISSVKLKVDRVMRYDQSAALNTVNLGRHKKTVQPNVFHLDFVFDGFNLAHALDTSSVGEMEMLLDMAAADSVPILHEFAVRVAKPKAA